MFVEHVGYRVPQNEHATIWRYVDLAKFLSLLESQTLWFARLDQFDDPFEGFLPGAQIEMLATAAEILARGRPDIQARMGNPRDRFGAGYAALTRSSVYVNCWHVNEYESGAMWKVYGDQAIAIRSTLSALQSSLNQPDSLKVYIGLVNYVDFDPGASSTPIDGTALVKRPMYDFEKELRAVILGIDNQLETDVPGVEQPIDVAQLIQAIYVGPGRASWYVHLIKSLIERYGIPDIPVIRSAMDGKPLELG